MHWGTSLDDNEKAVIISWAKNVRKDRFTTETVAEEFKNEPLQPLMKSLPTDPAKVELGFALYHDTRLSADNTISCATCHGLNTGGVDRKQIRKVLMDSSVVLTLRPYIMRRLISFNFGTDVRQT